MLKYKHFDKITRGTRLPQISENYRTGEEFILDRGKDSDGEFFSVTKIIDGRKITTFYYKSGETKTRGDGNEYI